MRIISGTLKTISVFLGLFGVFAIASFGEASSSTQVGRDQNTTIATIGVAMLCIAIALFVVGILITKKFKGGSLKDMIQRPVLTLDGGWVISKTQAVQFASVNFDSSHNEITFLGANDETLLSIVMSTASSITMNPNLRSPIMYVTLPDNAYTIAFVESLNDIAALTSVASTLKIVALGDVGAALSSPTALKASYGQIVNDRLETIHGWLRFHHVAAYKQKISRNVVLLCLFIGMIILAFVSLAAFDAITRN